MKRLAVALAALLAAPCALADVSTWNLDPAHSQATFAVRHLGISTVRGEFKQIAGKLALDEQDPTRSHVDVTIDVNSVDTRNENRDADLKSDHFFDAANYPQLTFKSTKIERSGDGWLVTGDLTLHGTTKPTTLRIDEFTKPITDPMGGTRRAVHGTGKLNRQDYGLKWNKMIESGPVVGDEVKLELSAEFVKAAASPAGQAKK